MLLGNEASTPQLASFMLLYILVFEVWRTWLQVRNILSSFPLFKGLSITKAVHASNQKMPTPFSILHIFKVQQILTVDFLWLRIFSLFPFHVSRMLPVGGWDAWNSTVRMLMIRIVKNGHPPLRQHLKFTSTEIGSTLRFIAWLVKLFPQSHAF